MASLRVYRGSKSAAPSVASGAKTDSTTVCFTVDGVRVIGVCVKSIGESVLVDIAVPDSKGVLHRTGSTVMLASSEVSGAAAAVIDPTPMRVKRWEASVAVSADEKALLVVRADPKDDKSHVVDYRDVSIEGYLSTFVGTTPRDRDGDYVLPTAFDKTLTKFRENPVMLIDHINKCECLVGSFDKIGTNERGLAVRGRLSNAPGLIDIRFKVAEGHLKGLSMGGFFHYDMDGRGILEVDLMEGSLIPVPANQDCLFQVRTLTVNDAVKMYRALERR